MYTTLKRYKCLAALLCALLTLTVCAGASAPAVSGGTAAPQAEAASQTAAAAQAATASQAGANRYNVCIVLDTSGSMKYTDPSGYRYDAVSQFVHLLSEQGDVLGGITFSTGIDSASAPARMDGRAAKEALADALRRVPATGGYTNIGLGLSEAVRQLKSHGDPSLPSVILLLSDGNTDMDSAENQEKSLEQKADAIQEARESGIKIYGVCLNVDNPTYHADVAEMDQVSRGTGGVTVEVARAEDLREVFNAFYDMIYGTSTTTVVDEVFPQDGILETRFDVPQVGVEEVNIIINGHTRRIALVDPSGGEGEASRYDAEGFTMLKIPSAAPGAWTLVTEGVPGDQIKVNMVYNSSLTVELSMDPNDTNIDVAQHVTFTASLHEGGAEPSASPSASSDIPAVTENGGTSATGSASENSGVPVETAAGPDSNADLVLYSPSPLAGYEARLNVKNAYRETLRREIMVPEGDRFTCTTNFNAGTYYFSVTVTGQYLTRESEEIGPVTFGDYIINTAPVPVPKDGKLTEDIPVYPFGLGKGLSYTLDLTTLATDPEGGDLRFEILSTPFIEGTDYTVEDNILTLDHFSIRKGAFTVRATDEYGLSCDVEVVVRTHNVGLLALLGTVFAAIVGLVLLYVLYDRVFPPFRGEITVSAMVDGESRPGVSRNPRRGKIALTMFEAPDIGLDPAKSYFKATGDREIRFIPSRPVTCNGLDSVEVRVLSGAEVSVCVAGNYDRRLFLRFDSRVPGRRRGGRPSASGRPTAGGSRAFDGHARPTGGGRSGGRDSGGHARPTGER